MKNNLGFIVGGTTFVLFMTGTLERHDGKKIAFLPYKEISNAV